MGSHLHARTHEGEWVGDELRYDAGGDARAENADRRDVVPILQDQLLFEKLKDGYVHARKRQDA